MAEVTQIDNLSAPMPPLNGAEAPKRKRGRPFGSTKAAAEPEKPVEPDEAPETELSGSPDFWLMLQNFSDDEWNNLSAYLYRIAPKIDRKANGRPSNIQIYTSRFTPDDIMKEHGSGAYQVLLNRMDPASGKYFRVAVGKVNIMNPKFPPVVPDGDWVDDKCNDMWKWGANTVPSSSNGGSYPPGFNIADMMDKADQRALRMVEIMTPKKDTEETSLVLELIKIATAKPVAPDTSSTDTLLKMLLEDRKQDREEMSKLRDKLLSPPPQPPQKSIIEQFVELRPQIKDLVDAFKTNTGKTDIWAEIAKEGVSQIPDVVGLIRDMVKKAPEPQQNGMGNHQPAQIAAASTATTAATEPPTKPVADMTEDEKRAYVDHLWKKWGGRLLQVSTHLIEEFTIQDNGYSFRDWYVEMYGKLNWADLKREVEPELMANMYLAHPQLQKALSPPPRLVVFLREFVTDFGAEDDTPLNEKLAAAGLGKALIVESTPSTEAGKSDEAKA